MLGGGDWGRASTRHWAAHLNRRHVGNSAKRRVGRQRAQRRGGGGGAATGQVAAVPSFFAIASFYRPSPASPQPHLAAPSPLDTVPSRLTPSLPASRSPGSLLDIHSTELDMAAGKPPPQTPLPRLVAGGARLVVFASVLAIVLLVNASRFTTSHSCECCMPLWQTVLRHPPTTPSAARRATGAPFHEARRAPRRLAVEVQASAVLPALRTDAPAPGEQQFGCKRMIWLAGLQVGAAHARYWCRSPRALTPCPAAAGQVG